MNTAFLTLCLLFILKNVCSLHYPNDPNNNDQNENFESGADDGAKYMGANSTDQKHPKKRRATEVPSLRMSSSPLRVKSIDEIMMEDPMEGTSTSYKAYRTDPEHSTGKVPQKYLNRLYPPPEEAKRPEATRSITDKILSMNVNSTTNYTRFIPPHRDAEMDSASEDENMNYKWNSQTRGGGGGRNGMEDESEYGRDRLVRFAGKISETPRHSQSLKRRYEGSNPREPESSGYPDRSSGCGRDVLTDLDADDFHVERPVWRGYAFNTGSFNREELQILEVVTEKRFYLEKQILEWKCLNGKAVGRGDHGLSLISSHANGLNVDNKKIAVSVSAMDMFEWWDPNERKMNTGVLLVQGVQINWNKFDDKNNLIPMWTWSLTYRIAHVSIYNLDGEWKVAITHEHAGDYQQAISIYGLELWKNFWYEQKLFGHEKPAIINNGRLLAAIHEDRRTVVIYKHDYQLRRYSIFKNFTSPEVESVVTFIIGSHSFLAIGGDNPVIYEIKGSEFQEKLVEHYRLEHVEQWLHVPLGYYRNDALLLFQHKLDHYTHSSSVLEALQWDGEKFFLLEHSPCRSHDEEMFGFSCILDAEGEKGVKGAAVFQTVDDRISILTASEEHTPIMFEIKTQLVQVPDPVDMEISEVLEHKNYLHEKLLNQQRVLEQAEKMISYASDKNEDVIFADNWKIDRIVAPSIHVEGVIGETVAVNVAGQDWRNMDFSMDTTHVFIQIKRDHDRIKDIVNQLKNGFMKKDGLPTVLDEVTLGGNIEVRGKVKIDNAHVDFLNDLHVDTVLENTVKKNKGGKLAIHGNVVLDDLNVENINVETINGINIINKDVNRKKVEIDGELRLLNHIHVLKDVKLSEHGTVNGVNFKTDIYSTNGLLDKNVEYSALNFDTVVVKNPLNVSNGVNGFDFSEKGFRKLIDESRLRDKSLLKDELVLETLTVGKSVHFDSINGKKWKNFIDRAIMKSGDSKLGDLTVNGSIKVGSDFKMKILNDLAFPDDYFLLRDDTSSVFTSPKTFVDVLEVDEIDCEGLINGIKSEDIVTLSTRQNLDNLTFFDLTVTEMLNIQGNITGKELDAFLSNPKLTESHDIKSNVIFKNLRVNGTLKVANRLNGSEWSSLFGGVVMKTDKTVNIDSLKTFEGYVGVENDLTIRSGFVNNRRVTDFFTVDTDQMITSENLNGNIHIVDLQVDGAFDNVNVSHLNDNVITLTHDQTFESNMIFDDDAAFDYDEGVDVRTNPVDMSELVVRKRCNSWAVPDEIMFNDNKVLELNSPQFDNLFVDHLIIEGDLHTKSPINGIDLSEFDTARLSKSATKEITAPYTIKNCLINSITFGKLNGIAKYDIDTFMYKLEHIDKVIKNGGLNIGTLHVAGKLNVNRINDVDLREITEYAVWLKDDNHISGAFTFMDKIYLKSLRLDENAHGVNFEKFIADVVQIDPVIKLTGRKIYTNGLEVLNDVKTDYVNDVNVYNILSGRGRQTFTGNLHIDGDLIVLKNLNAEKYINDIRVEDIGESLKYVDDNEYLLEGDFHLEEGATIGNLIVHGLINQQHDLENIINSTVGNKEDENYFDNTITFMAPVIMKGDLNIKGTYNDVYLQDLLDSVVFKGGEDFINSTVVFKRPVVVKNDMSIKENASCDIVQYCSVKEWISISIFLDGLSEVGGVKTFKNLTIKGDLITNFLNDVPFDRYVTLHTEQTLLKGLIFDIVQIEDELLVGGMVNLKRFDEEFNNIFLMNQPQDINSPIIFHSDVYVTKDAFVNLINGKNAMKIVNLDSDQILEGNYNFHGNTVFSKNFNVFGPITETNLNVWMRDVVYKSDFVNQLITGNWNISGKVEFRDKVDGKITLNELNMDDFDVYLDEKSDVIAKNEDFYNKMYGQLCNTIDYINGIMEKRIYLFKHLEEIQSISSLDLLSVHQFDYDGYNYLIMSNRWECDGYLWRWNTSVGGFEKLRKLHTGCPKNWYTIRHNNSVFLLSTSEEECDCKVVDTTVWVFDGIHTKPIKSLKNVESVSVARENGGVFYAKNGDKISRYAIVAKNKKYEIVESFVYGQMERFKFVLSNREMFASTVTDGVRMISLDENRVLKVENERLGGAEEILEFVVGRKKRKIAAVVWPHQRGRNYTTDYITIYEDVLNGKELQTISCHRPSSLVVFQLYNHETLLLFVENRKHIQVYAYKGFAGFQHLYQINVPADKIAHVTLNNNGKDPVDILVVIGDGTISIVRAMMYGTRKNDLHTSCIEIFS